MSPMPGWSDGRQGGPRAGGERPVKIKSSKGRTGSRIACKGQLGALPKLTKSWCVKSLPGRVAAPGLARLAAGNPWSSLGCARRPPRRQRHSGRNPRPPRPPDPSLPREPSQYRSTLPLFRRVPYNDPVIRGARRSPWEDAEGRSGLWIAMGVAQQADLTLLAAGAYMICRRPDGRVAMQRTANPRTAVRFRFRPPGGQRLGRQAPRSPVAQLVERAAVNRLVAGSSPARGAKSEKGRWRYRRRPFPFRAQALFRPEDQRVGVGWR